MEPLTRKQVRAGLKVVVMPGVSLPYEKEREGYAYGIIMSFPCPWYNGGRSLDHVGVHWYTKENTPTHSNADTKAGRFAIEIEKLTPYEDFKGGAVISCSLQKSLVVPGQLKIGNVVQLSSKGGNYGK